MGETHTYIYIYQNDTWKSNDMTPDSRVGMIRPWKDDWLGN